MCCSTLKQPLTSYERSPVAPLTNPHFAFSCQTILCSTLKKLYSRTLTNYPTYSPLYIIYKHALVYLLKQLLQSNPPSTLVDSVHSSQPLVQKIIAHFAHRKKTCHSENFKSQPSRYVHFLYISFSCVFTKYCCICLPAVLSSPRSKCVSWVQHIEQ